MAVKWVNFGMYEAGWLACVCGAAAGWGGWGAAFAGVLVGLHVFAASERWVEVRLIATAGICGLVVDCVLMGAGILKFSEGGLASGFPPIWMTVLWMQFATALRYCLSWMGGRYVVCGLLAFVGCTSGIHWWGADGCGDCVFPCPARSAEFGIALVSSNTVSGVAECATEWRGCCGELSVDGTREVVALMVAVCVMQPFLTH